MAVSHTWFILVHGWKTSKENAQWVHVSIIQVPILELSMLTMLLEQKYMPQTIPLVT